MADSPARAAWRALVARLGADALREAAHLAVDAAIDAANDVTPRRAPVRPVVVPDGPVDEVAKQRAGRALDRLGVRRSG